MPHLNNRRPEIDLVFIPDFDKITKADWCDLYFDLFRQVFDETAGDSEIMSDVKKRLEYLMYHRRGAKA